ncbi:hypothetical protein NA56DRAFT_674836 [Hyaloscypha hepaticicola]|uniref:Cysteine dioxygenase n=1 Tax=Hyaloscypha hepaticicola TaxID=2082293 RepID=A0A2J6PHP4_9HELO|nr:hypothetical protein NA56DRAFT_674836 [Hyaloscypha hepaticicola]
MAFLKTGITRALRSRVPTQNPLVRAEIQRGITATAKTANWTSTTSPTPQSSTPVSFPLSATSTNPFTTLHNDITHSLTTTPSPHLPTLHSLLRAYSSDPTHWSKYAHANPQKQYTRNLVCAVPGLFNLLLLVWTPGRASPIHDHASAHCLMKILQGSIRERRFATPAHPGTSGPLVETSNLKFGRDKVTYMADSLGLHEIKNESEVEYAVSLHLYTPPNAAVRGVRLFDGVSGEARHVMQGEYDSVRGVVPPPSRG